MTTRGLAAACGYNVIGALRIGPVCWPDRGWARIGSSKSAYPHISHDLTERNSAHARYARPATARDGPFSAGRARLHRHDGGLGLRGDPHAHAGAPPPLHQRRHALAAAPGPRLLLPGLGWLERR